MTKEIKFRYYWSGQMYDVHSIDVNLTRVNGSMVNGVLMQFTGLKDKNGKDIYEGDIVKVGCNKWFDKQYFSIGEVKMGWFGARFGDKTPFARQYTGSQVKGEEENYYDTFEIIGDVYSNPELIK